MTIANGLAERIHSIGYDSLPQDALRWARAGVLDKVGVTLAGASEPYARIAARVLTGAGSTGPSLILGGDRRAAMLDAAMINGTTAHALDFDDCATSALAPDTARHRLRLLRRIDDLPRIIHLTAAMLPARRAAP